MTEITRTAPEKPHQPAPAAAREGLGGPALLLAVCVAGIVGAIAAARPPVPAAAPAPLIFPVERAAACAAPEGDYTPAAQAITPITSLAGGSNRPAELGGSTTGSLYASADRIDIYARTSSSTATIALVEYQADDGKWVQHGSCPTITTDLTLCRIVTKRGSRYWHVYKSAGTLAYTGVEPVLVQGGAALGGIEFGGAGGVTSVAMSLPAEFTVSGSPVTSTGTLSASWASVTNNHVLAGPAGASPGTPAFRSLVANDIPNLDASKIDAGTLAFARLPAIYPGASFAYTSVNVGAGRYPVAVGVQTGGASGTTTASSAYHLYLPAFTTWRLQMITSYSYGGGNTLRGSVRTASTWGGTYSEAAFVTTTSGGVNSVFSTDFIVGGSPLVAIFECYHATSALNNVILRFFQVG